MGCNETQKEIGGKDLLIKACVTASVATTTTEADFNSLAHGLKVGDIVSFQEVGGNTTISVGVFYYVKTITDADNFQISSTVSGVAIVADDTEAALDACLYQAIGGIRSKSFSINSEAIDITNEDSDEWKLILDKAGMRSVEISGDGVHNNSPVLQALEDALIDNVLVDLMFIEAKNRRIYQACYKIASLELSGGHDNESSFSISASSSGKVTRATIAP